MRQGWILQSSAARSRSHSAQKPLAFNSQKLQCFGRADDVFLGRCSVSGSQIRAILFGVYALGPDTLLGRSN